MLFDAERSEALPKDENFSYLLGHYFFSTYLIEAAIGLDVVRLREALLA